MVTHGFHPGIGTGFMGDSGQNKNKKSKIYKIPS